MSNRQNQWDNSPSLSKTIGSIVTVVGTMAGFFGALSSILSGLGAPIAALLIGLVVSVILFYIKFWTPQTAIITWLATSVALIIVYLIISQPATVTGQVIDDQEMPVAGLRLILTNSAGIVQRVVTDQDGNFEILNVPDGRYTISVEATDTFTLLYTHSVSSGWQRIFTPEENTGGHIYHGVTTVTQVPTNAPVPTLEPETPTSSPEPDTPVPTSVPTNTLIPSPEPATPVPTVTSNDDWTPIVQEFNGVEMVLVPRGCFMMGSEDGDSDEEPVHEVCFEELFWIDRYEVSNGQFEQFGGVAGRSSTWTDDNLPREDITWFEARDFCELRDARLPTEAEWEYAARGVDGLVYPWGNTYYDTLVNDSSENGEDTYGNTAPVTAFANSVSWVGAHQMSGNVLEWVNTIYDSTEFPYPYVTDDGREDINRTDVQRVLRGGSWYYQDRFILTAYRYLNTPDNAFNTVGLRCARNFDS